MTIMKIVMAILQRSKPKPMQTQKLRSYNKRRREWSIIFERIFNFIARSRSRFKPPLAPTQATAMSNTFNDDPFDVHLLDTQHHHQQNSNNSNHNRGQNLSNGSNNLSVSGPGMGMNNLVFGDSTHAFDINFNIDSLDDIWTTTGPGGDITGTGSGSGGAGGTDDDNFMGMNWAADQLKMEIRGVLNFFVLIFWSSKIHLFGSTHPTPFHPTGTGFLFVPLLYSLCLFIFRFLY